MYKLLQLLNQNRVIANRKFEVRASADEATIYLYDMIVGDQMMADWYGGVCPQVFVPALMELTAPVIHLRINSPGGDVFAANTMVQAMRDHPSQIITHVDGVAASAASVITVNGDSVEISSGGMIMIHNGWTWAVGNSQELLSTAALLEKVDGVIAQEYVDATGQDLEQIRNWMNAETWFTAEEAVASGFADKIMESAKKSTANAAWNLSAYSNAPKSSTVIEPTPSPQTNPRFDAAQRHLRIIEKTA